MRRADLSKLCRTSRCAAVTVMMSCLLQVSWAQETAPPDAPPISSAEQPAATSSNLRQSHLMALASTLQVSPLLMMDASKALPSPDLGALGLESAISLGLTSNLDVQAAQHRAVSFSEARNAARGALLTKLDLKLGYGRGRLDSVDPHVSLSRQEATLTLRQPLFDAAAHSEWQRQGVLAGSALVQQGGAASGAAMEIAQAYLQAMQLRLTIEINKDYEGMLNELLRYITERAAGGAASAADRDRVRSRVASARTAMADARANFKLAQRNLERLLGEPVVSLVVQGLDNMGVPEELREAKEKARAQNHDILAAQADVAAAQLERTGQLARFLPRVDLELTRMRNINAAGTESRLVDNKAMVMVTIPLLNGGTDIAQVRGAQARREEQCARALNVERKVMQDLEAAYANIDSAGERYRSVTEELQANQSVVDAFKAQLTAANRSLLDVLDAYQRLYQTKLDITQVVVTETQNHIKVAHLTGSLLASLPAGTP